MRDQLSVCILLLALELIGCNCFETAFRTQTENPRWDESPLNFKLITCNTPPHYHSVYFPFAVSHYVMIFGKELLGSDL